MLLTTTPAVVRSSSCTDGGKYCRRKKPWTSLISLIDSARSAQERKNSHVPEGTLKKIEFVKFPIHGNMKYHDISWTITHLQLSSFMDPPFCHLLATSSPSRIATDKPTTINSRSTKVLQSAGSLASSLEPGGSGVDWEAIMLNQQELNQVVTWDVSQAIRMYEDLSRYSLDTVQVCP